MAESRQCLTKETFSNTVVDTLADTLPDVEGKTLFDTGDFREVEVEAGILVKY